MNEYNQTQKERQRILDKITPTPQGQHTPTPWKVSQTGKFVMHSRSGTLLNVCEASKEDAAFIVRAVNSHEELFRVLKSMHAHYQGQDMVYGKHPYACGACEAMARAEGE